MSSRMLEFEELQEKYRNEFNDNKTTLTEQLDEKEKQIVELREEIIKVSDRHN